MSSLIDPEVLKALFDSASLSPAGCFVEVGVYQGGSANVLYGLAETQGRTLHLFDTFNGMPFADPEDKHQVGEFGDVCLPGLRQDMPNAHFHVGIFPATCPPDLRQIAFAHVDCDQYRSVSDCITLLWPKLVLGGIMWFDDYGALPNARRAVDERFAKHELCNAPCGRVFIRK